MRRPGKNGTRPDSTTPTEEPQVYTILTSPSKDNTTPSDSAGDVIIHHKLVQPGTSPRADFITYPLGISKSYYVHVKSVVGIKIKNKYNEVVESCDLLNKDMPVEEEIEIAMLQLRHMSKTRSTAGVLNNLGCAYALLDWIKEATEVFEEAIQTQGENDAINTARTNLEMLKALED